MTVTDIILIHGAWNRGACYDAVVPLLEARGYRVHAPDLTGHTPAMAAICRSSTWSIIPAPSQTSWRGPRGSRSFWGTAWAEHPSRGWRSTIRQGGRADLPDRVPHRARCYAGNLRPARRAQPGHAARAGPDPAGRRGTRATGGFLAAGTVPRSLHGRLSGEGMPPAEQFIQTQTTVPFGTPNPMEGRALEIPRLYIEALDDVGIPIAVQRQMQKEFPGPVAVVSLRPAMRPITRCPNGWPRRSPISPMPRPSIARRRRPRKDYGGYP